MAKDKIMLAFPSVGEQARHLELGMTLRDWFAGQALGGLVITLAAERNEHPMASVAAMAYEIADAMLARRSEDGS